MKAMVVGISPEYNYPGTIEQWKADNTFYASNLGGSLITNALLKQFSADYVNDFSNIDELNEKYDACILALATHVHERRDVSRIADLVEKLDMKVVAPSLGVSDYVAYSEKLYELSPSVKRLLSAVADKSSYLGARGPYTASILQQNGFKNVLPVGCPSLFWNLGEEMSLSAPEEMKKVVLVYHRTFGEVGLHLMDDVVMLGQDFQDEALFTDNLKDDSLLQRLEQKFYEENIPQRKQVCDLIEKNGIFIRSFQEWFAFIQKADFVFGPRLHGCIGAIIQGVPAVFTPRDMRVEEIVEFFDLPFIPYKRLKEYTVTDMRTNLEYSAFLRTYKERYRNYVAFLEENRLEHNLAVPEEVYYAYTAKDHMVSGYIANQQLSSIKKLVESEKKQ